MIRRINFQVLIGWLLLCSMLASWMHFAAIQPAKQDGLSFSVPPLARLEPKLLKLMFVGEPRFYQSYLAYWAETVFARATGTNAEANQLFADFDLVAKHEPKSEWFYIGPCLVFSERLRRPELCFAITEYGQKAIPSSWRIPLTQAYIEQTRLNNPERSRFFLEIAARKANSPSTIVSDFLENPMTPKPLPLGALAKLLGEPGFQRFGLQTQDNG